MMGRRSWIAIILAALSVTAGVQVVATAAAPGVARADVCASVGRHVRVGGCANLRNGVARYAPPPEYYAPLPEDLPPPPAP